MTKDDMIRLAREAGVITSLFVLDGKDSGYFYLFERFATLVAAAEREACAKVCESLNEDFDHLYVSACAEAIRARGQHD